MTIAKESYKDVNITILKLKNKYIDGTVKVESISSSNEIEPVLITELGEDYIELPTTYDGFTLLVEYEVLGTIPEGLDEEFDIKKRLRSLERSVDQLYSLLEVQKEAINNRLSVTSFKAWTGLIEKKMGIVLIEENLNHISRELYKNRS